MRVFPVLFLLLLVLVHPVQFHLLPNVSLLGTPFIRSNKRTNGEISPQTDRPTRDLHLRNADHMSS